MRFSVLHDLLLCGTIAAVMIAGAQHTSAQPAPLDGAATAVAPRLRFDAAEMDLANRVAGHPDLAAFYGGNGLRRVFGGDSARELRKAVALIAAEAAQHGLPANRYLRSPLPAQAHGLDAELAYARVLATYLRDMTSGAVDPTSVDPLILRDVPRPDITAMMRGVVTASDPMAALQRAAPQSRSYQALQAALADNSALTAPVGLPRVSSGVWRQGLRDVAIGAMRTRLSSIGFPAPSDDPELFDVALSDAVAGFQQAAGLQADGIAGPVTIGRLNGDPGTHDTRKRSIAVALERLRWMSVEDLSQRHVWVNIPEFTARIIEGERELFRTRVVVGTTEHSQQTPEFSDRMEHLVVNPRWNVPRSITVNEYLPKLKANRHAVSHLDIIDGRGNVVSRESIDFARHTAASFPFRMRQKPSEDNALGLVKFIFPNPWNIYLHDTPSKHLFANRVRAYSHGCVRVGDPLDLAVQLLAPQADDPRRVFQNALDSGRETWLALTPEPPVHLVYFTAYPDAAGQIRYFGDIYGRDAAVWAALQRTGLE